MTLFDFRFSSFQFAVLNAQGCELRDDIDGPLCVEDIFQCFMNKKTLKSKFCKIPGILELKLWINFSNLLQKSFDKFSHMIN